MSQKQRTSSSAKQAPKTDDKQKLKERVALAAATDVVCTASPRAVQEFLSRLEQRGDIVQNALPSDEILPCLSEEEEFDIEWDSSDEDENHEENQYESFQAGGIGPYESEDAYVIRVERLSDGTVGFDLPETGGEAYRGVTPLGNKTLEALSKRAETYKAIVKWLQGSSLASIEAFLAAHEVMSQKDFIDQSQLDVAPGTFSKYVRNARLAWDAGSIPLSRLFKLS